MYEKIDDAGAVDLGVEIDSFLDQHRAELVDLLCELVAIDSQIPPHADERRIIEFLQGRLDGLGIGRGTVLAADPARPNLVVRLRGSGAGRTLVFNGHVDTKPIGQALALWRSDPFVPTIDQGRLFGLGASDMKASIAAMVFAAAAVREVTDGAMAGDLVLALTADEEAGGQLGSKFVAPRLDGADACLIGEPSGWERDWQGLHLVSRGICCFRIRVRGTQMHSSLSDRMPAVNASLLMAELMVALGRELELEVPPHPLDGVAPTLNVGVLVSGGVYFGVLPGEVEFACDLRTVPGMAETSVRESLESWVAERRRADPHLDAEITFEPDLSWIPPSEIAADHPLVECAAAAAADVLGSAPPLSMFPGTTDAPWFSGAGIPTIPSFGPGILACAHGPNEYVDLESVHEAAKIYARIATRFCADS